MPLLFHGALESGEELILSVDRRAAHLTCQRLEARTVLVDSLLVGNPFLGLLALLLARCVVAIDQPAHRQRSLAIDTDRLKSIAKVG